jgi:hypothetical protein
MKVNRILRKVYQTPSSDTNIPFVITATFAANAVNPSISYAKLKYNKRVGLHLTADDGGAVDGTLIPSLLNQITGITDGAGNAIKPGFTFALTSLINGRLDRDGTTNPEVTPWAGYKPLLSQRHLGFSNHSSLHSPYDNTKPQTLPLNQIKDCAAMVYDRLGIILRTVTVPGGFDGFAMAMASLTEYLGCESEGYGPEGSYAGSYQPEIRWLDKVSLPWSPTNNKWVLSRKFFNQDWGVTAKSWFDEKIQLATNEYNQGLRTMLSAFDHFPASQADNFVAFLKYTQTHPLNVGGDSIWYANFQEFLEYEEVKRLCAVSAPIVDGNTVTWTIDRSALPGVSLYQDASLLITGGTLTNVTVTGGDSFAVNKTTGLLNISKLGKPVLAGSTTPPVVLPKAKVPVVIFEPQLRILSSALQSGESGAIEYRHGQSATPQDYTSALSMDGAAHVANEWQFRVKATSSNQASDWVGNLAFDAKVVPDSGSTPTTPGVDNDPFLQLWEMGSRTVLGKIPYSGLKDVYCTNNVRDEEGQIGWTDNSLTKIYNAAPKLRDEVIPTRFRIDVRKYRPKVSYIKIYSRDWTASQKFYYIEKGKFARTLIGEVQPNAGWVTLTLPQPTDVCWLEVELGVFFDSVSEFEIYGTWIDPVAYSVSVPRVPFSEMLRVNAFPWNLLKSDDPKFADPAKLATLKSTGGIRQYFDWLHVEPVKGQYMFGPSSNDYGSWNEDTYLQVCKDNNLPVTVCFKNSPAWLSATWPSDLQTSEQLTVEWQGDMLSTMLWAERPEAYLAQGKMLGQFVMRNGPVVVDPSRLKVYHKADGTFPSNEYLTGLDTIDVIEANNESDSWWRGRQGYATGRQQAARDSACFDGHKGTLGADVGIRCIGKTRIKFSVAGRAVATLEHERGYKDWCRENRGYLANGKIDFPFDYFNYHAYATDGGITQTGDITRGLAPELANYTAKVNAYTDYSGENAEDRGVIIGEFGYDISNWSTQSAIRTIDLLRDADGNVVKDQYGNRQLKPGVTTDVIKLTQLQWALRTAHEVHQAGAIKLEWYMLEDASNPYSDYSRYSACGMINPDGSRRPAANGYHQVKNLIGEFLFDSVISATPRVHRLKHPVTNKYAYVLWSPTETDVHTSFNLPLGVTSKLYTIDPYGLVPSAQNLASGTNTIAISELPCYVLEDAASSTPPTTGTGTTMYSFVEADPTIGRVDESNLVDMPIADTTALHDALIANLDHKRLVVADGVFNTEYFEQLGTWNHVLVVSANNNTTFRAANASTCIIIQGNAPRSNVAFRNIKFESTYTGGDSPLFYWDELPSINGMEVSGCSFTCPNSATNALGCVQYSTASNAGNLAQNVLIQGNKFQNIGRCAIEMLSQGYDGVIRLKNLIIRNNTFSNMGLHDPNFGMAVSLSGLFQRISLEGNTATQWRKIAYEFVNVQYAIARNNNAYNGTDGVGYGISDDNKGYTADIYIEGGNIKAPERPFYIYQGNRISLDGKGMQWTGGEFVQVGSVADSNFKNLDILIQSLLGPNNPQPSWEWGAGAVRNKMTDCSISSAGSIAAGRTPAYEAMVLREGATDNILTNVKTILGRKADGTTYAPMGNGGEGEIVNHGGTTNIITNNMKSVVA